MSFYTTLPPGGAVPVSSDVILHPAHRITTGVSKCVNLMPDDRGQYPAYNYIDVDGLREKPSADNLLYTSLILPTDSKFQEDVAYGIPVLNDANKRFIADNTDKHFKDVPIGVGSVFCIKIPKLQQLKSINGIVLTVRPFIEDYTSETDYETALRLFYKTAVRTAISYGGIGAVVCLLPVLDTKGFSDAKSFNIALTQALAEVSSYRNLFIVLIHDNQLITHLKLDYFTQILNLTNDAWSRYSSWAIMRRAVSPLLLQIIKDLSAEKEADALAQQLDAEDAALAAAMAASMM